MRLGVIPEGPLERVALALGLIPTPLVDTQLMLSMAQAILSAERYGVFEALLDGPLDAAEVAAACGTHPEATEKLLNALAGVRYLRLARGRYRLPRRLKRWLDPDSPRALTRKLALQREVENDLLAHVDDYLTSGEPVDMHAHLSPREWGLYQAGMRDVAALSAREVAWRTPVPRGARHLLDIGGAHGLYAAALCRRHPQLEGVVLDLPQAVAEAAPLLAAEGLGERLRHRAGDARSSDLGEARYDVVFTSQLAHHLSAADNRALARRVERALRPGGVYVIQDLVRPEGARDVRRLGAGALLDLYFGATSASGTWTLAEMAAWQREAGLEPQRPRWLRTLFGAAQQVGVKPR